MNLRVIEIFESIQGESSFAGLPFTFIRLAGCNLRCTWCDSKYSYVNKGTVMPINAIIARAKQSGMTHICVTGGEPLLQENSRTLLTRLSNLFPVVTLETNGSMDISSIDSEVHRIIDIKCPSSGMVDYNLLENLLNLRDNDEIKCVIASKEDYEFACDVYKKYLLNFQGYIYFSVVLDRLNPQVLAKWVLSDKIPIRIQVQLHKILGIE